ncbi:MAG: hypothetical protein PHI28_13325 [Mangrovibacterium sp.]|nr:hypothetical protein [Mangrovibacterium sp.]
MNTGAGHLKQDQESPDDTGCFSNMRFAGKAGNGSGRHNMPGAGTFCPCFYFRTIRIIFV